MHIDGSVSQGPRRLHRLLAATLTALLAAGILVLGSAPAQAYKFNGCRWGPLNLNLNVAATSQNARIAINEASNNYTISTEVNVTNITSYSAWAAENIDYGPNGWSGYNTSYCPNGITQNTQTRLNNYYMSGQPIAMLRVIWLHEIGHGLGLDHVNNTEAVMDTNPKNSYYRGTIRLGYDDIAGINARY